MSRITEAREVILTSDTTGESWSAAAWDPRNGSLLSVFKNAGALGHRTLQLLSDSYVLGANATKSRMHIWPLNGPLPVTNVRLTTPGKVNALTCTPNGSYMIAGISEKLYIWQTCSGRMLANLNKHYQPITCVSITKDGSLFASAGEEGLVFVWSLFSALNDKCCAPIHKFCNSLPVRDLYFGHGGVRARLYMISLDKKMNIYELGSGDLLAGILFSAPLTALAVNICESEVFVGCTSGDIFQCNLHNPARVTEQDAENMIDKEEIVVFKAHKSNVTALSVSVDCRTLLSGSVDKAVHIWDIGSQQVLRTIEHKGPVTAAFFAMGYENFRASVLQPRLEVCSLQSEKDKDDKDSVIKVLSRGRNPTEILNFEFYVGSNTDSEESAVASKLESMQEEIEKLKKINTAMYQHSVTRILNEIKDGQ